MATRPAGRGAAKRRVAVLWYKRGVMHVRKLLAPLAPWAALFRLPNLATAAGDAVAGGSLALATAGGAPPAGAVRAVFTAAVLEFLLYLGGLADNDLCDMEADRACGKPRPLATGALSRRSVRIARAVCFLALPAAVAPAFGRDTALYPWFLATLATAAAILLYNRIKEDFPAVGRLLMGSCRGLALAAGFAAGASAYPPGTFFNRAAMLPLAAAAAGWTLYVAAVTRLGECEETAGAPLGPARLLPWLFAVLPFAPHVAALAGGSAFDGRPAPAISALAAMFCALAAAATWIAATLPLGRPHGPGDRGRAVGRTIGGLLWMQTGLALCGAPGCSVRPAFAAFAAACWCFRAAVRRLLPAMTGS